MVKVIMGPKGTGKTKQMIDLINTAVETEHGNVVAIAHDSKLTFDINYKIRLVETSDYDIPNYDTLKGFLYGLYASNYDITHVFIDSLNKLVSTENKADVEAFLDWLEASPQKGGTKYTASISEAEPPAREGVRKYFKYIKPGGPSADALGPFVYQTLDAAGAGC